MKFYTISYHASLPKNAEYPCAVLSKDNWDDYGYRTLYHLSYYKQRGKPVFSEGVKILRRNENVTETPEVFNLLDDNYCSLGISLSYYIALASLGKDIFQLVLSSLNDVAFNRRFEELFINIEGFETSLLRKGIDFLRGAKSLVVWYDAVLPHLSRFKTRIPTLQDVVAQLENLETNRTTMRHYDYFRDPDYGDLEDLPSKVKQNIREAQEEIHRTKELLRSWSIIITDELEDEPLLLVTNASSVSATNVVTEQTANLQRPLRVFLCHSFDDKEKVRELYKSLRLEGFSPWLDEENILPGQKWQNTINQAIRVSDVVIVCVSTSSVKKEGYVQREISSALNIAEEKPEDTIFIIPLRFDECDIPKRLNEYHAANYFETQGRERLMQSLRLRANDLSSKL